MSSKFQKGDNVRIVKFKFSTHPEYVGRQGLVVDIVSSYKIKVELDNEEVIVFESGELAFLALESFGVARKDTMSGINKLTILAKSIVDADLRNMIKVGWLDSSLQLTEEGEEAILAHYLSANKADLGKLAEAELKERRKDKGREE